MEETIQTGASLAAIWGVRVLSAILILIAGWVIGNWIQKRFLKIQKLDETLRHFLGGLLKYSILSVALITVLAQFGVQTASLIAVLGAAGLAIGLALQGTLSNVAAGVMLLVLRPFNVGDFITFGSTSGTVKSLGLFGAELSTSDNVYIFCPNSAIWNNEIMNFSRNQQRRQDFIIGISYNDDMDDAIKTLNKVVSKEERLITTDGKEPQIMVSNMGDFSVDIIVRIWCKASDYWTLKWDMTKAFKEALDKDGITIPFPTQIVEHVDPKPANNAASANKDKAA